MTDFSILFEDTDLLVIDKPPGIVVNRAESVQGDTVADWSEIYLSFPKGRESGAKNTPGDPPSESRVTTIDDFYDRAGIVHRIDKETSGCLIIAKNFAAFVELQRQFKEHIVKKTYLAITHGAVVPAIGEIRAPVGRLPWNRERFGIVPGGKESLTRYSVKRTWKIHEGKQHEDISLLELYPETGRTHQIRVHLKYINHPIIGDWQYAGRKTSRSDRLWAPRVMLHAYRVVFLHPVTQKELAIEAPIPDDMNRIITEKSET